MASANCISGVFGGADEHAAEDPRRDSSRQVLWEHGVRKDSAPFAFSTDGCRSGGRS